jgi:hypothetical protein
MGLTMEIGNEFFRAMMSEVPEDFRELSVKEWTPTPFLVDVNVEGREEEIRRWLHSFIGSESSPMHKRAGNWRRSFVTLNNKSWFGFSSQKLLDMFSAYWSPLT